MKFGVRECCDVVFRAKSAMKIGKKQFYKDEPVIYFDTLKTSTLEGAATTVYATGGRGNARLMAWEGERTLTFTMEDALISPEGIAILTGAGIIEAGSGDGEAIYIHATEEIPASELEDIIVLTTGKVKTATNKSIKIGYDKETEKQVKVAPDKGVYIMIKDDNGNIISEPFSSKTTADGKGILTETVTAGANHETWEISVESTVIPGLPTDATVTKLPDGYSLFVDYYVEKTSGAYQIDIAPDKFGGYFYIEAATLFRDQATGVDMPAEFIIPNGKVQSNFTFTMAGSGDPSTFTFTVDAFPGRVNGKEVLAAIQVIKEDSEDEGIRPKTDANEA